MYESETEVNKFENIWLGMAESLICRENPLPASLAAIEADAILAAFKDRQDRGDFSGQG